MGVIERLARGYFDVVLNQRFSGDLSIDIAGLSLDEAYQVQQAAAALKEQAGMTRAGWKVGCTSPAIQGQLGLNQPIQAPMYQPLIHPGGTAFRREDFLSLAIEPELVICLGADIPAPPPQPLDLLDAIEWVAPGIELHNKQFFFDPVTSQELVASGGLWAGLVVGETKVKPTRIDLSASLFQVLLDGQLVAKAPGSDIMGGPLVSLLWLARRLAHQGRPLSKGELVIPGSPTELISIDKPTLLTVDISGLGRVGARFQ
jgi:2-keto-4-pentenoate hydratase